MQIVKYEEQENSILVGFKKHNFVVYGMIGKIEGLTKEQHLQKLYEQCKSAIDYEEERYLQGKSNSILTELEGEEFVPEEPKATKIKLLTDKYSIQFELNQETATVNLSTEVKDQYRDDFIGNVTFVADYGTIKDNVLTIPKITENKVILITANVGDISDTVKINAYPYIEPQIVDEPVDDEKIAMAEAIVDLNNRIQKLEGVK